MSMPSPIGHGSGQSVSSDFSIASWQLTNARRRRNTPGLLPPRPTLAFFSVCCNGEEAKISLEKRSAMLDEKWENPYSEVCGYVNARMSIAFVKTTDLHPWISHCCLSRQCGFIARIY
jgi:hypothetical protein